MSTLAGLALAAVANLAVLFAAHAIVRNLNIAVLCNRVLAFWLLRLFLISLLMLVLGVAHCLNRWVIGVLAAIGVGMMLRRGDHRHIRMPQLTSWDIRLTVVACVVGARLLLQVLFFSPHLGDALAYHLPKIPQWVQEGGFTLEMGIHPHVSFPAGFELLETWWVIFLHHDALVEMAGVEFVVLAFLATYSIARHLQASPNTCFFSGLIYALTPGFHLSATSCLNDAAVAALVIATFAAAIWSFGLPLLLVVMSLGVGTKATYAYALPGALAIWCYYRRRGLQQPGSLSMQESLLSIASIPLAAFWYLRNLVWFGNPVYPVGSNRYSTEPVAVQLGPRLSSLTGNLWDLITKRIYDNQCAYGANVDNISGWGPVAFSCGIIATIALCVQSKPYRALTLAMLISLASVFLLSVHDPWSLKYCLFFPTLLAVSVGNLSERSKPILVVACLAVLLSFLGTFLPYDLPKRDFLDLKSQPLSLRSAMPRDLRTALAGEERVGCFGGPEARPYCLYAPDFSRRVLYLRADSASQLLEAMKNAHIRYVYAVPYGIRQRTTLEGCVRRGRLHQVSDSLYRLRMSQ